jgi:hypothetical protein
MKCQTYKRKKYKFVRNLCVYCPYCPHSKYGPVLDIFGNNLGKFKHKVPRLTWWGPIKSGGGEGGPCQLCPLDTSTMSPNSRSTSWLSDTAYRCWSFGLWRRVDFVGTDVSEKCHNSEDQHRFNRRENLKSHIVSLHGEATLRDCLFPLYLDSSSVLNLRRMPKSKIRTEVTGTEKS